TSLIWGTQERNLSKTTPRFLTVSLNCNWTPSKTTEGIYSS
ncbi:jg25652, partial [Pararge aegeria aegeria]